LIDEFPMYLVESSQFLVTRHTPHRGYIRVLIIKKNKKNSRIDMGCVGSRMDMGVTTWDIGWIWALQLGI